MTDKKTVIKFLREHRVTDLEKRFYSALVSRRANECLLQVWATGWNQITGYDKEYGPHDLENQDIVIGYRNDPFISGVTLRSIINGGRGYKEGRAYIYKQLDKAVDITNWFWEQVMTKRLCGVLYIGHQWRYSCTKKNNFKTCACCGRKVKEIVTKTKMTVRTFTWKEVGDKTMTNKKPTQPVNPWVEVYRAVPTVEELHSIFRVLESETLLLSFSDKDNRESKRWRKDAEKTLVLKLEAMRTVIDERAKTMETKK